MMRDAAFRVGVDDDDFWIWESSFRFDSQIFDSIHAVVYRGIVCVQVLRLERSGLRFKNCPVRYRTLCILVRSDSLRKTIPMDQDVRYDLDVVDRGLLWSSHRRPPKEIRIRVRCLPVACIELRLELNFSIVFRRESPWSRVELSSWSAF